MTCGKHVGLLPILQIYLRFMEISKALNKIYASLEEGLNKDQKDRNCILKNLIRRNKSNIIGYITHWAVCCADSKRLEGTTFRTKKLFPQEIV